MTWLITIAAVAVAALTIDRSALEEERREWEEITGEREDA